MCGCGHVSCPLTWFADPRALHPGGGVHPLQTARPTVNLRRSLPSSEYSSRCFGRATWRISKTNSEHGAVWLGCGVGWFQAVVKHGGGCGSRIHAHRHGISTTEAAPIHRPHSRGPAILPCILRKAARLERYESGVVASRRNQIPVDVAAAGAPFTENSLTCRAIRRGRAAAGRVLGAGHVAACVFDGRPWRG